MGHKRPTRSLLILIIALFLALFTMPALAQDSTAEATPVSTLESQPVTIVNAGENGDVIVNQPAATETAQDSDLSARDLLFGLIAVVVSFLLYRSVPADKVADLWAKAEARAKETPGTLDDDAVAIGKMISDYLARKNAPLTSDVKLPTSGAATVYPDVG